MRRRELLALLAFWALSPPRLARAVPESHVGAFEADVGILFGALNFHLAGTIDESVDRPAGRYDVKIRGQGDSIEYVVDATGLLHEGRWVPGQARSRFVVHGRESRLDVTYDWARRSIDYRSRQETFFLRRLRVTEDVVTIPAGTQVDDAISATLNYADGIWLPQPDGSLATHVVRRHRPKGEGADDVQKGYRAELVPFVLRVTKDPATGRPVALFDLTRFSSWAKEDKPARIVFGPHRRPETITTSLMLGTSVAIRISNA
jgi:hypothetical protein